MLGLTCLNVVSYTRGRAPLSALAGDPGKGPGPGAPRRGQKPQQPGEALPRPRPIREGRAPLSALAGDLGKGPGPGAPRRGQSLNNLAWLYHAQGQYEKAEPLYQRSLAIREKALGPSTPTWPRASTTWRSSTTPKANTRRPSPSTSARWRSRKGAGAGAPRRGHEPQQPGDALPRPRPIREGRASLRAALAIRKRRWARNTRMWPRPWRTRQSYYGT